MAGFIITPTRYVYPRIVTRPRNVTVHAKDPTAVIKGLEMGRVSWGYQDGLLGSLGEGGRRVREFESMVEDVTFELQGSATSQGMQSSKKQKRGPNIFSPEPPEETSPTHTWTLA